MLPKGLKRVEHSIIGEGFMKLKLFVMTFHSVATKCDFCYFSSYVGDKQKKQQKSKSSSMESKNLELCVGRIHPILDSFWMKCFCIERIPAKYVFQIVPGALERLQNVWWWWKTVVAGSLLHDTLCNQSTIGLGRTKTTSSLFILPGQKIK